MTSLQLQKRSQSRIEQAFYVCGALFVLCAGKVLWLQTVPRISGNAPANKVFERSEQLPARRGQLLARDGTAMAVTIDEYTIAANPRGWGVGKPEFDAKKDRVAQLLAQTLGGSEATYRAQLNRITRADGSKNFYIKLAKGVDEAHAQKLRELMGPQKNETRKERTERKKFWEPVTLEASPRRHYPLGAFAPQLIGFTTNTGRGEDGMERAWEDTLGGKPGMRDSLVDAQGRAVPGTVNTWREPVDGQSIVTTIDPKIQEAADATLTETCEKYKPNFCVAVVMKPKTGEVVAVSTAPGFNLNNRPKNMVDLATNRAFSYSYEPGSTWKIITASAVVENVPNWQSKQFYVNGVAPAGSHLIHDWQYWSGHVQPGMKGISEGIRDSSNVCMWDFAQLMPRRTLMDYAKNFGIDQKEQFLPGFNNVNGYLPSKDPKEWPLSQWANFSFGQGMMITPLQLARIGSVIANDGVMMKPMLIKEIHDQRGQLIKSFKPEVDHKVIEVNTAREVKKMMRRVVSEGTARKYIFIPGYAAAGKTGSAQKAVGKAGYSAGKFISSFVGLIPMENPQYVIAVMADEPHGSHWGSEVCGPAFTKIAEAAMVAMRLEGGSNAPAPNLSQMERPSGPEKH